MLHSSFLFYKRNTPIKYAVRTFTLYVEWNILVDNKKTSLTFSNESESKPWKNYLFDNFILIDWGSMQSIGEVFGSVPNLVAYVNIYLVD